jgi:hypothetical protein
LVEEGAELVSLFVQAGQGNGDGHWLQPAFPWVIPPQTFQHLQQFQRIAGRIEYRLVYPTDAIAQLDLDAHGAGDAAVAA